MLHRRSLLQSGAALSVLALHPLARAQAVPWPERAIKLINGFAAGGGASDIAGSGVSAMSSEHFPP